MRKRNYQINPQSENELKKARTNILPDLPHGEDFPIISVNSSKILGIERCEEELRDIVTEEYKYKKLKQKVNEDHILYVMGSSAKTAKKLSVPQIALIYAYEDKTIITRENAQEIIEKYGWTSGEKLYQQFNNYRRTQDRIADPDKTKKSLENKIKLFESVIQFLTQPKNQLALDEINTLKSKLNKNYLQNL